MGLLHDLIWGKPVNGGGSEGGGGGESDFIRILQTVNVPKTTLTGVETSTPMGNLYVAQIELENANENLINTPESEDFTYTVMAKGETYKAVATGAAGKTVEGVDVAVVLDLRQQKISLMASSDIAFTVEAPADIVDFYIVNPDLPWSEYFPTGRISDPK